jgi:hypothetical protein
MRGGKYRQSAHNGLVSVQMISAAGMDAHMISALQSVDVASSRPAARNSSAMPAVGRISKLERDRLRSLDSPARPRHCGARITVQIISQINRINSQITKKQYRVAGAAERQRGRP